VEIDAAITDEWGRLNVPDPLPIVGGLLAASASIHGWTLATRDAADLKRAGVQLLNPFEPKTVE
jgi:toxin FitB